MIGRNLKVWISFQLDSTKKNKKKKQNKNEKTIVLICRVLTRVLDSKKPPFGQTRSPTTYSIFILYEVRIQMFFLLVRIKFLGD